MVDVLVVLELVDSRTYGAYEMVFRVCGVLHHVAGITVEEVSESIVWRLVECGPLSVLIFHDGSPSLHLSAVVEDSTSDEQSVSYHVELVCIVAYRSVRNDRCHLWCDCAVVQR